MLTFVSVGVMTFLQLDRPLVAAPMAGGPSTPLLVAAAVAAGGTGFLAAGYRTPEQLATDITSLQSLLIDDGNDAAIYGVNLFNSPPVTTDPEGDLAAWQQYRAKLTDLAAELDVTLPETPSANDDFLSEKLSVLLANPVPLVSFTFGLPSSDMVSALHAVNTRVGATVTDLAGAEEALARQVDFLVVQGPDAGGHQSLPEVEAPWSRTPLLETLAAVRATTDVPIIAAGGVGTKADVQALVGAGATAVALGTMLLCTDEAGTNAPYRQALLAAASGARPSDTLMTRAFSGRWARALVNSFTTEFSDGAPSLYPQVHYLTSVTRGAAKQAGNAEALNLWAGAGVRHVHAAPLAEIFAELS